MHKLLSSKQLCHPGTKEYTKLVKSKYLKKHLALAKKLAQTSARLLSTLSRETGMICLSNIQLNEVKWVDEGTICLGYAHKEHLLQMICVFMSNNKQNVV